MHIKVPSPACTGQAKNNAIKSFNDCWISVGWPKCRCDDMPYRRERNLICGALMASIFFIRWCKWMGLPNPSNRGWHCQLGKIDVVAGDCQWGKKTWIKPFSAISMGIIPLKEDGILRLNTKFTPGFWTCTYPAIWFTGMARNKFKAWLRTTGGGMGWDYGKPHKYDAAITIDGNEIHIIVVKQISRQ